MRTGKATTPINSHISQTDVARKNKSVVKKASNHWIFDKTGLYTIIVNVLINHVQFNFVVISTVVSSFPLPTIFFAFLIKRCNNWAWWNEGVKMITNISISWILQNEVDAEYINPGGQDKLQWEFIFPSSFWHSHVPYWEISHRMQEKTREATKCRQP